MKKKINYNFFFIFAAISIPFQQFIISNSDKILSSIDLIKILFLLVLIVFILLWFFLKFNNLLTLSLIFLIFFNYFNLKILLGKYFLNSGEISLIIIILISTIIFLLRNKIYLLLFSKVYLTINFSYSACFILFMMIQQNQFLEFEYQDEKQKLNVTENNNFNQKNIYLIIPDQMISADKWINNLSNTSAEISEAKIKYKNYLNHISKFDYSYYSEVEESYSYTYFALTSILSLDYISEIYKRNEIDKFNIDDFYPYVLSNDKFNKFPLKKLLDDHGYKFKWVSDNLYAHCLQNKIAYKFCIDIEDFTEKNINFFSSFNFYNYGLLHFYKMTPFIDLIKFFTKEELIIKEQLTHAKITNNLNNKINFSNKCMHNDSICKISEYLSNNKLSKTDKYFFLIHHMNPHSPYYFQKDCQISDSASDYNKSYMCTLLKIENLIELINKKDPEAVVVIVSDHGLDAKIYSIDQKINTIFVTTNLKNKCSISERDHSNSINITRKALSCALNKKIEILNKKRFFYDGDIKTNLVESFLEIN